MRPPGSPEAVERRRQRAIALFDEGYSSVDVAAKLGVSRRSVRRWKAAYQKRGAAGIRARPAPGRPPKLGARDRRRLERALLEAAKAAGFETDLWTCRRVARLIRREFGVAYHVDHIGRLLRAMDWTPQCPQRRAIERDEARVRGWVREDWPRIKEGRRAAGRGSSSSTKPGC